VRQLRNDVIAPQETVAPIIIVADPGELEKSPAKSKTVWTWAQTVSDRAQRALKQFPSLKISP
jgi:hypothetical protein